jgi:hypothetical protein
MQKSSANINKNLRILVLILSVISSILFVILTILMISRNSVLGDGFITVAIILVIIIVPPALLFTIDFSIKKGLKFSLLILSIVAIEIVCTNYYYGFDLQWGFSKTSSTWGLPLLVIGVGSILTFLFCLVRRKWFPLTYTLIFCVLTIVYFNVLLLSHETIFLDRSEEPLAGKSLTQEEKILVLILANRDPEETGYYTVVDPMLGYSGFQDAEHAEYIRSSLNEGVLDIGLIDKFIELNKYPSKANLPSNPEAGYYFDYAGQFDRYYENGCDNGWSRVYKFHPNSRGHLAVSLPAYDPETGYVLIYERWVWGCLFGSGDIYLYKYENGSIREIGPVMHLWTS